MAMTAADRHDYSAFLRPSENGGRSLELLVNGARCAACLSKIETEVRALPAVESARLNLTTGKLTVGFAPGAGDPSLVLERLDGLGYPATLYDPGKAAAAPASFSVSLGPESPVRLWLAGLPRPAEAPEYVDVESLPAGR